MADEDWAVEADKQEMRLMQQVCSESLKIVVDFRLTSFPVAHVARVFSRKYFIFVIIYRLVIQLFISFKENANLV